MTFSRDEEVLMMLYSPGSKSGLVKALRKMSADLDLDDPEDNQLYQLTQSVQVKLSKLRSSHPYQFGQYRLGKLIKLIVFRVIQI